MEQGLKERLTGAAVLVILAVIFIPMLLDDTEEGDIVISETNIPPKPETMPGPPDTEAPIPETGFTSKVVPLEEETPAASPEPEVTSPPEMAAPEQPEMITEPADSIVAPPPAVKPAPEPETEPETGSSPDMPSQSTAAVLQSEDATNHVGLSAWVVQLGVYSSASTAEEENQKLRKAGFRSFVEPLEKGGQRLYRVRVGPELKRSDAQAINDKLKSTLQMQGIVVQYP